MYYTSTHQFFSILVKGKPKKKEKNGEKNKKKQKKQPQKKIKSS
jgi:hypothetical protein